jgi:lipid-binding SYLF domain-containing protein
MPVSAVSVMAFAQLAPAASEIGGNVNASLPELYSHSEAAKTFGAKAKAVLVFPGIRKAAFIVGARYGYGTLRKGARTVGYYRTGAASYGVPGWRKEIWLGLFFMTDTPICYDATTMMQPL